MLVRKTSRITVLAKKKNTINVTVSMPEWLWMRVCELLTMIKHKRRYRNVVTGDRSESHLVKQHRHGKTTACSLCAAHEKWSHQAEAKSSTSEAQVCRWATPFCDFGTMQFVAWADSVLRFSLPVQGFLSEVGALTCSKLRTGHRK